MTTFWTRINTVLLLVVLIVVIGAVASRAWGGPLDPPGAPSSTLPQVEPRIPIDHVPFDIVAAGSYFLTRDVSGAANTGDGITIESDGVTLDLNGFSVIGTGADGSQVHGFGIAVGTAVLPTPRHNIVIRNGVVHDWNYGVVGDRAHESRIESVRTYNNKWDGVRGGSDSTITDSSSAANGEYGIVSFGGTVQHSEVDGNTNAGIFTTDNSVVKDNSAHNNLSDGISLANNTDVEGNSVYGSGGQGIVSSGDLDVIKDNVVEGNTTNGIHVLNYSNVEGNTVNGSGGQGIVVGNRSVVKNNSVQNLLSNGIFVLSNADVEGNTVLSVNGQGIVSAGADGVFKNNLVQGSGGDGIHVLSNSNVEGNSVIGSGGEGIVSSGSADVIKDNMVQGSATSGIDVLSNSTVEGNTAVANNASNTVGSSGILSAGNNNSIAANHATQNHLNDILLTGSASLVRGNSTQFFIGDPGSSNVVGPEIGIIGIASNTNPDANFIE